MSKVCWVWSVLGCGIGAMLLVGAAGVAGDGGDGQPAKTEPWLIDSAGKERKLLIYQFVAGFRALPWAVPEGQLVPTALEMRELDSTTFKDGVLTFLPLESVRSIQYDYQKETLEVRVAGIEKPFVGSIRFRGINLVDIEATVEVGKTGLAEARFRGGVENGFREVHFPNAKPAGKLPEGPTVSIVIGGSGVKEKGPPVVGRNLRALYRLVGGKEIAQDFVLFKKDLPVKLRDIRSLVNATPNIKAKGDCTFSVKLADGSENPLTLLSAMVVEKNRPASLLGLLIDIPGGYRLFPPHTIASLTVGP
jgi:hypothetical protein